MSQNRAFPIVRVSDMGDRTPDCPAPEIYRQRIRDVAKRERLDLLPFGKPELDVSGGLPLEKRPGLFAAVRAVEAGRADVIIGDFDRLFRSLKTQTEVIERIEAAGGRVLSTDFGSVSYASAVQWYSATMMGAATEFYRRKVAENVRDSGHKLAREGIAHPGRRSFGYMRDPETRKLIPHPVEAPIVLACYEMRARGASIIEIRLFLESHDVWKSDGGVRYLLKAPVYIGTVLCGTMKIEEAHPAIVRKPLYDKVQRMHGTRGRLGHDDQLFSRLRAVHCATCKGCMVAGKSRPRRTSTKRYPTFRCNHRSRTRRCSHPQNILAHFLDTKVAMYLKEHIADAKGRDSLDKDKQRALKRAQEAEKKLSDAAVNALEYGIDKRADVKARLAELEAERNAAQADLDRFGMDDEEWSSIEDWDIMTPNQRKALIRVLDIHLWVGAGVGLDRITVTSVLDR